MYFRFLSSLLVLIICAGSVAAQNYKEAFNAVYKKFKDQKVADDLSPADKNEIKQVETLLDYLHSFTTKEAAINGGIKAGFSGDATDINELFQINAGINLDYGNYPYQLDFSTSIQTLINNGQFQENVSNIDISFDYHHMNVGDGVWLENYFILKRFSDNYLGINQRYETGAGFIFNFYADTLTQKGEAIVEKLEVKPILQANGDDLIVCYEEICNKSNNPKRLLAKDIKTIAQTRKLYRNANRKKFSLLRLALLVGAFYEIDQSFAQNILTINNRDTMITAPFPTNTWLRWELRPSLEYQPNDKIKIKIHPFLKLPLSRDNQREVRFNDLVDIRADYFIDLRTSFKAKVTDKISLGFDYRYLYDNAPNRVFLTEGFTEPTLLIGQQRHHIYMMNFGFDF